jgi:hypothetical protein
VSAQGPDTTIAVEVDDVPPNAQSGFASKDRAGNKQAFAFTYGYIRPFYRDSIKGRGVSYPTGGSPMTPGTHYELHFPSAYMDYVLHAGHQLRFTFSDASDYSIATEQGGTVTMYLGNGDGTSLVKAPEVAYGQEPVLPELPGGPIGIGGPVLGLLTVGACLWFVRRRFGRVRPTTAG